MVVAEGQQQTSSSAAPVYDVVFVVEATAALCGYIDSIKTNYILPALEFFNGGPPDEIDYGCDYSCTMYSLVLYRSGDSAPEPASSCIRPTTSTHKFIKSLDAIRFYGGAGEAYSHMSEGLATALQVFDDLNHIRGPYVTTQKHCVVVCNSPAYQLPSQESFSYAGLLPDQLAVKLTEKEVNFSVMAPRKMPAMLRLFDKANSDTPSSQMRNFTVDSRHLVLLKGFSLQERPQSPSIKKDETPAETKSTAATGNVNSYQQQPSPAGSQGLGFAMSPMGMVPSPLSAPIPSPLGAGSGTQLPQPSPPQPGGMNQQTGAAPGLYRKVNSPAPSLPQMLSNSVPSPVNPMQKQPQQATGVSAGNSVQGFTTTISNNQTFKMPSTTSGLTQQLMHQGAGGNVTRMANPTGVGMNRPSAPTATTVQQNAAQEEAKKILQQAQAMSTGQVRPNQPGAVQGQQATQQNINMMQGSQPSLMQGTMTGQQSFPGQTPMQRAPAMNQMGMSTMGGGPMAQQPGGIITQHQQPMTSQPVQFGNMNQAMGSQPNMMQGGDTVPGQGNLLGVDINNPQPTLETIAMQQQQQNQQKRIIWTGALEWTEKPKTDQPSPALAANRITRSLACNVAVAPTDPDVNATKWPNKLIMQLIPQQLLQPLSSLFKNSRKVFFSFSNNDVESLKSLYRVMANGFAGYVHFPGIAQTEVRLLMLLYSSRQRQFMGLIPNEQARFVQGIKTIISKHKQNQLTFKTQGAGVSQAMQQVPNQQLQLMSNDGSAGRGSPRVMSPQQPSPLGSVMFQGLGTPPPSLPPPPLPPPPPPPPHHHLHHYVLHPHDMVGAAMGGMGSTMTNAMPTNTTLGGMLGGSQQVSNMAGMAGGQVQQGQQMPDDRSMGMPGTFDMGGNMAAGAPGGMQPQQQMITPGQQQQFARQQQQQLLAQQRQQLQQQQQQQRMQLQLQQQQQQQMGHQQQQQLKHLLMNQQQQQQLRQQQQQQQMMMQQQRGPRPVGPQAGMMPQGMPQQQTQSFMGGDSFDLPDLGL